MTTFDPFAVEEIDDSYTGTITDVTYRLGDYGFDAVITTRYDEPRTKNDGTISFERPEFIKVAGKDQGFVASGDGKSFSHPDGKTPRANSAYGRFTKRVKELCPSATAIEGLHVTWDREGEGQAYSFTDKVSGEKKEGKSKGYFIPVAVSANGATAKAYEVPDLPTEMLDALTEAAQTMNLSDFRVHALTKVEGVAGNDDAKKALAGDEFYNALQQF